MNRVSLKCHTICATFRLSSPTLCGGHDHQAELRLPSIKGQLCFWWRALAWSKAVTIENDREKALHWVHQQEGKLFGSIAAENMRQSAVLMSIDAGPLKINKSGLAKANLKYLLCDIGGRNAEKTSITKRSYIESGNGFTLRILVKPQAVDNIDLPLLCDALKVMGSLGGIGARVKKGFGSLSLEQLSIDDKIEQTPTENETVFTAWLAKLIQPYQCHEQPPYSAFSHLTKVYRIDTKNNALTLLEDLAKKLQKARVRTTGNENPPFLEDYNHLKDVVFDRQPFKKVPERVSLGLPIQYKIGEPKKATEFEITAKNHERRGSPIQFHIQQLARGRFVLLATFLPADFLPAGEMIQLKMNKRVIGETVIDNESEFWQAPIKLLESIGATEDGL